MRRAFGRHPGRIVVLIGSDVPSIEPGDIRAAGRALTGGHVVFGPAADGGYWLIGMSGRRLGAPFADVRWSSEHALADTARNFRGRPPRMLRRLRDVDSGDDLAVCRDRLVCNDPRRGA